MTTTAVQLAREQLVVLRRERLDLDRKIAATETYLAAMTGRAVGEAKPPSQSRRVDAAKAQHGDVVAVLEALDGTQDKPEGMERREIQILTELGHERLSRALAWLVEDGKIIQTNLPNRRNTRFKVKTEADRVVVRLHGGA